MSMVSLQTLLKTLLLASLVVAQATQATHAQGGSPNSTTTLDALSPAGTVAYGSTRTYSGTVTPAAVTGDVQVLAGTTVMCTATLVGTTSKTYSCTSASIPNVGTYNITGKYLGNATYKLSTSAARSQTISKISPSSLTLTSSSATPTQGSAFTLTTMVTVPAGTTPTGTVNFRNSANTSLTGCGAVALTGTGTSKTATCSVTETTAGSKTYNALYSGDVNFTAGTNPTVSVTVKGTTTTTLNALSPAGSVAYAVTRTYSGGVTPAAATGSVQVLAGSTLICSATLTGTSSKTFSCTSASTPNAGSYSITAQYQGDSGYVSSTSAAQTQTITPINPGSVSLASSSATPATNTAFTLTTTVTVPTGTTPTGSINFRNSANASLAGCAAVALTGTGVTKTATCSVTETAAGAKTYNALYSGDVNFTSGTNPTVAVTVSNTTTATSLALTASATTLTYPSQPTLTATLTPNTVNVGTVSFKRGTTDIAGCLNLALPATPTPPVTLTCTPGITDAGSYTYSASYSGGTGTGSTAGTTFSASSGSSQAVTIAKASPSSVTLTSSTATPVQGAAFTLTTTVTTPANTTPTGSINFRDGANGSLAGCSTVALTGSGTSKTATCSVTDTATGAKTYNALYSGDVNFTAGSNPTVSVTVISNVPANNNTGNNSAADPVLIDVFYVHPDHLGTPRAVTNPSTNLKVWEWESTPFGETLANENPQNLTGTPLTTGQFRYNLRFPGQFFDAESGKHYNYFRDYDPQIGRYTESDPIGLRAGYNTFGYVGGAPVKYFDLLGLDRWFEDPGFYWKLKPGTPWPRDPELLQLVICMSNCVNSPFTVTSTSESGVLGHGSGTGHGDGRAFDIRYRDLPDPFNALCCAKKCGARYARDEGSNPSANSTAPHFHIELPHPRNDRWTPGDMPKSDSCNLCVRP